MARSFLAPLDMGSNKITSLATPTASGDAATKGYVDGLKALLKSEFAAALTNSTTATSIFASAPTTTPVAGDVWEIEVVGTLLNNTGSNQTLTTIVSFGGTTLVSTGSGNVATSATARSVILHVRVAFMTIGASLAAKTSVALEMHIGQVGSGFQNDQGVNSGVQSVLDTSTANNASGALDLKFQFGAANASLTLTYHSVSAKKFSL